MNSDTQLSSSQLRTTMSSYSPPSHPVSSADGDQHPDFCPDAFFDLYQSWETDNPNLSSCLRDTVLSAAPLTVLLASLFAQSLVRVSSSSSSYSSSSSFPRTKAWDRLSLLFWTKAILNLVIVASAAGELIYRGQVIINL